MQKNTPDKEYWELFDKFYTIYSIKLIYPLIYGEGIYLTDSELKNMPNIEWLKGLFKMHQKNWGQQYLNKTPPTVVNIINQNFGMILEVFKYLVEINIITQLSMREYIPGLLLPTKTEDEFKSEAKQIETKKDLLNFLEDLGVAIPLFEKEELKQKIKEIL